MGQVAGRGAPPGPGRELDVLVRLVVVGTEACTGALSPHPPFPMQDKICSACEMPHFPFEMANDAYCIPCDEAMRARAPVAPSHPLLTPRADSDKTMPAANARAASQGHVAA